MTIFLNKDSKVIVQGITGGEGSKHTARMLAAGTQVFDAKRDGVGYATTGDHIKDITGKIDDFKKDIIDGKLKVESAASPKA